MAEVAGAALIHMERFYGHFLAREAMAKEGFSPYPQLDQIAAAAVVIDAAGRRFVDEGIIYMSNVVASFEGVHIYHRPGYLGRKYPANPTIERAGGKVYARRIRTISRRCRPIDPANNPGSIQHCHRRRIPRRTGHSPEHAVPAAPLDLSALIAIPLSVGITTTMGGIAIDANMGVKRPDGSVGLLAAGSSTGGLEGDDWLCRRPDQSGSYRSDCGRKRLIARIFVIISNSKGYLICQWT